MHLTNMLGAVEFRDYRDPTMLLRPREDKLDLLKLPEDVIVLKWASLLVHKQISFRNTKFNTKLSKLQKADLDFTRIQNFSSDMKVSHT